MTSHGRFSSPHESEDNLTMCRGLVHHPMRRVHLPIHPRSVGCRSVAKAGWRRNLGNSSGEKRVKSSSSLLSWYSNKLDTHPILTKSITSATIAEMGDILSQYIESRKGRREFSWDMVRTARFGVLGLVLVGPVIHTWYGAIARIFPGSTASVVAKQVAIDQFLFAPLFLPTFLSSLWILEDKPLDGLVPALQQQMPSAIVVNWLIWVPAQIINFRFMPTKYQVLFSNVVAVVWNTYLSYTIHNETEENGAFHITPSQSE